MRALDRHQKILEAVTHRGVVRTADLAQHLRVSEETVRKDLILLEEGGKLRRMHGGASRAPLDKINLPLPERTSLNQPQKSAIAKAACSLIEPRQTVFLDASSTVLAMTEHFPEFEATVLTNASHIVVGLGERPKLDLVCTGGQYERRSRSYVGALAEEKLSRFLIEWLFVGVDGLDVARGASEINPGQARLKEKLISLAERVCVLTDHTKLGRRSSFFFASLRQIDMIITDAGADPEVVNAFRREGVSVRTA